ncbi:MAG: hypothetical protein F6K18_12140 [Okeania sp. SIO2C2]|uniref:hypothetical protein n=1 Tax=Okeania sp. SIO2C2 TaxID=2607787 RepID=UPI0013B75940|nr:hypothetical protein [Okeania sp. SIO2C2]NEP87514.1 hypothetical protein [Okeania sp. SIO2C2]
MSIDGWKDLIREKQSLAGASQDENVGDSLLTRDGWKSLMMGEKWKERSLSNTLSFYL